MKIELKQNQGYVTIIRDFENDPKIYNDSKLWYMIRNELLKQGYDVIKKLMWKDGNMVDNYQHYVRSRKFFKSNDPALFMLHDGNYMIRPMYVDWNEGKLILEVHWNKG